MGDREGVGGGGEQFLSPCRMPSDLAAPTQQDVVLQQWDKEDGQVLRILRVGDINLQC